MKKFSPRELARRSVWPLLLALAGLLGAEELPPEKFDQQSLALRTTLFHDPTLEQPLKSLIDLYQKAGKADELLALYRNHVAQYPDDAGSHALLVRLLLELKKPEATTVAQTAVAAHPDHAFTLYLRHLDLEMQRDPRSLDFLSQAIEKETEPSRKRQWTDKLVASALAEDRRELAEKHLRAMVEQPGLAPDALAALAQRLNRDRFHDLALAAVQKAEVAKPSPETGVELALQAAAAEAGLGRKNDAAARLDALLKRVAPDYARRPEIVSRRVSLVSSDAEREAMLKAARAAREAAPSSEAAVLDLAELLIACELRLEALKVLREAATALPQSERLEKATLALLDRLGDERGVRDYVAQRLATQPGRTDLIYRLVRALYALGAKDEAATRFATLLEKTDAADRTSRRLDLARSLRRMSLPAEAVAQFQEALKADPTRLDVRRELAEALLATGDAEGARRLVREAVSPDAEIENFLDVIGFMAQQGLWAEARDALRVRQTRTPKDFEVAMRLVEALGQLGEQAEGELALARARELADTDARYRRWVEAGVAFAERVEATEALFEAEQARLTAEAAPDRGGWTPSLAARFLTLCEVARQGEGQPKLVPVLREKLADPATPPELRVALHRLLVEALGRDPKNAVEVQNHLEQLVSEDATRADEYRLRLARAENEALAQTGGRSDRVRELLRQTDVAKVADVALLRTADKLFQDYGFGEKAFAALERLTELEPGEKGPWERWLTALAGMGDEERLREALRRLLAGVTKEPLSESTLDLLRGHLVDSCWRSVAKLLAGDDADSAALALPLLEVIERTKKLGEEQLWVTWARGMALGKAGRRDAAAEAAGQIEALAKTFFPDDEAEPKLIFPDGLSLGVAQALALLRDAPTSAAAPAEPSAGPVRPPALVWGYETDGATVVQIIPAGDRVLVADDRGTLAVLNAATGKLERKLEGLWSSPAAPVAATGGSRVIVSGGRVRTLGNRYYQGDGSTANPPTPRLAAEPAGERLFLCHAGHLVARSVADGRTLWEAQVEGTWQRPAPPPGTPMPPALVDEVMLDADGRVIVWRPEGAVAAAFHPETGKLLWTRDFSRESANTYLAPGATGASCEGRQLLVYGHRAGIVDTRSGAVVWGFDVAPVREFPVVLKGRDDGANSAAPAPVTTSPFGGVGAFGSGLGAWSAGSVSPNPQRKLAVNHLRPLAERSATLSQWMSSAKGSLVAPAVAWAESGWGSMVNGTLVRGRVVLSNSNVTQALSLAMPLAAQRFDGTSTWVGAAGNRAVFVGERAVTLCDLSRGGSTTLALDGPNYGPVDAVVAGGRVYVTTLEELVCVNALTQRVIFRQPWPDRVKTWAGAEEQAKAVATIDPRTGANGSYTYSPRWIYQQGGANGLATPLRPRHAAAGARLFLALAPDKVGAFAE